MDDGRAAACGLKSKREMLHTGCTEEIKYQTSLLTLTIQHVTDRRPAAIQRASFLLNLWYFLFKTSESSLTLTELNAPDFAVKPR